LLVEKENYTKVKLVPVHSDAVLFVVALFLSRGCLTCLGTFQSLGSFADVHFMYCTTSI